MKNSDNQSIEKKYKTYKWIQYITFVLSIISCLVPVAVAAINIAPKVKETQDKIALGGVGAFILAVVALIVFRSLVSKYISKLPYTLTVLISVAAMLLLMICLKHIIDDAIAILIVSVIGSGVGFALELVSMYCKAIANELKERYKRDS